MEEKNNEREEEKEERERDAKLLFSPGYQHEHTNTRHSAKKQMKGGEEGREKRRR